MQSYGNSGSINRLTAGLGLLAALAAGWGDAITLDLLLRKKANPNIKRNDGATGLMIASKLGHDEVVKVLLMGGANPNLTNAESRTARMIAEEELRSNKSLSQFVKEKLRRIVLLLKHAESGARSLSL